MRPILISIFVVTTFGAAAQTLPTSVDWIARGVVTPVKNMGQCGSDWAFAATGALEGATAIWKGKLFSLSEQQLIDCAREGNAGCNGGHADAAFQWVITHGIALESNYPYTGRDGSCKAASVVARMTGYHPVATDMQSLMAAVALQPVAAMIYTDDHFSNYKAGVFECRVGPPNFWVTIVGYGSEAGKPYWLVKNAWGPNWGDHGYIRMTRDSACANIRTAYVPVVQ